MYLSTSTEDFPEMYLSTFQVLYKLYLSTKYSCPALVGDRMLGQYCSVHFCRFKVCVYVLLPLKYNCGGITVLLFYCVVCEQLTDGGLYICIGCEPPPWPSG